MPKSPAFTEPPGSKLVYDVYVGGLNVLQAKLDVGVVDDSYRVSLDAELKGFVAKLFSMEFAAFSEGRIAEARPQPVSYRMRSSWQKKERGVTMAFDGAGGLEVALIPEPKRKDRDTVSEHQRAGSLDPVSASLWLVGGVMKGGGCAGSTRVFDGKKLFDLKLVELGREQLEPSSYGPFGGEALVCELTIEHIAGHMASKKKPQRVPTAIRLYMATVSDTSPPLPLRLEGKSALGAIRVHLSKIEGEITREQLVARPKAAVH